MWKCKNCQTENENDVNACQRCRAVYEGPRSSTPASATHYASSTAREVATELERTLLRIDPHQAGVIVAVLSVLAGVLQLLVSLILGWQEVGMALITLVVSPVLGYISTALSCWVLNLVLKWCGGLHYTCMESERF
mgnify:CR=1 FL=1